MTQTPHDALFKSTFSNPVRAMQVVNAILPRQVAQHLDFASARLTLGSFVGWIGWNRRRRRHSSV